MYQKEDLDKILNEKGIQLPEDFYNYLTNVSSNYVITFDDNLRKSYPIFYDDELHENANELLYEKITDFPSCEKCQIEIPENVTEISYYFPEMMCGLSELDTPVNENHGIKCIDVCVSMVRIGQGADLGYFPYYIYLGKGSHYGSIWLDNDDTFYSEFPTYEKTFSSFTNFLKRINKIKQNPYESCSGYEYKLCENDEPEADN